MTLSSVTSVISRTLLTLVLLFFTLSLAPAFAADQSLIDQRIELFFPEATHISEPEGEYRVRTLANGVGTFSVMPLKASMSSISPRTPASR